jgi:ribosome-associated toxin RatA of RatAB toxin-antitoxin module
MGSIAYHATMPKVDVDVVISATVADVWTTINDVEAYASFMENVRSVSVVSHEAGERVSSWSVLLKGSILEWTEREIVDDDAKRVTFEQLDGDLDEFSGYWQLEPKEDGVRVVLAVTFEIGIPLLAEMLNPVAARALRDNSLRMLEGVGNRLEHR